MALSSENQYLASDFIALKARVKEEMLRRKYKGTLVSYGSSAYDYTVAPQAGNPVLTEHINKIVIPLNAINDTGIQEVQSGDAFVDIRVLDAFLTKAEGYSLSGKSTDCKSSCSGLCVTGCGTTCTGCSGSCSNNCSGCTGCGSACQSSCQADNCKNGCIGTCKGTCHRDCQDDCWGGCKSNCQGTCKVVCGNNCTGSCKGSCSGGVSGSPS